MITSPTDLRVTGLDANRAGEIAISVDELVVDTSIISHELYAVVRRNTGAYTAVLDTSVSLGMSTFTASGLRYWNDRLYVAEYQACPSTSRDPACHVYGQLFSPSYQSGGPEPISVIPDAFQDPAIALKTDSDGRLLLGSVYWDSTLESSQLAVFRRKANQGAPPAWENVTASPVGADRTALDVVGGRPLAVKVVGSTVSVRWLDAASDDDSVTIDCGYYVPLNLWSATFEEDGGEGLLITVDCAGNVPSIALTWRPKQAPGERLKVAAEEAFFRVKPIAGAPRPLLVGLAAQEENPNQNNVVLFWLKADGTWDQRVVERGRGSGVFQSVFGALDKAGLPLIVIGSGPDPYKTNQTTLELVRYHL